MSAGIYDGDKFTDAVDDSDNKPAMSEENTSNVENFANLKIREDNQTNSQTDGDDKSKSSEWTIDDEFLKECESQLGSGDLQKRHSMAASMRETANDMFRSGNINQACQLYTDALQCCPLSAHSDRAALFSNRAACFIKMEMADLALCDCDRAIELLPTYEKALMRRAQLHCSKPDSLEKALQDYEAILKINPNNSIAKGACQRLPGEIAERNEKMKAEILTKLKELGNLCLRPFGLSTDNFKLKPNESGGYSVEIQQKPS